MSVTVKQLERVGIFWIGALGLPFVGILTEANILDVLDEHGVEFRDRDFNPVTTIWGFLGQVLSEDHSCRDAVSRIIAHRAANGGSSLLAEYYQLLQRAAFQEHNCHRF